MDSRGLFTNSKIGPTWDNPKLRHFYWLLSRLTTIMTGSGPVVDRASCRAVPLRTLVAGPPLTVLVAGPP